MEAGRVWVLLRGCEQVCGGAVTRSLCAPGTPACGQQVRRAGWCSGGAHQWAQRWQFCGAATV